MGLLIHLGLSVVFGRIVAAVVWKRGWVAGLALGGAVGLVLFLVNFHVVAPSAFPWFAESISAVTAADHVLFGVVAAATCLLLRDRAAGAMRRRTG
jgi:hypothetical protein